MVTKKPKSKITTKDFSEAILGSSDVSFNLGTDIIITNKDKIKLCLIDYKKRLKNDRDWITPLGFLITTTLVFLTSDFHDFIFPKHTWEAFFVLLTIFFSVWLIRSIKNLVMSKEMTIDQVIEKIKRTSPKPK